VYSQPYAIGYPILDEAMKGGVREGDLIVVTGLSGCGKTTLCQNISLNLSKELLPSLWFSYEVMIDNVYAKFKEMGVPGEYFMIFTPKRNTTGQLNWVKDKIKEGFEKEFTKFVFIDHLDFILPTRLNNGDQERIIVRNICTELKEIAMELKVVIFLVAHVRKTPRDREVEMQDVAESRAAYQIPDYILVVSRNYDLEKVGPIKIEVHNNLGMVRILKNRLTGSLVRMNFELKNNIIIPCNNDSTFYIPPQSSCQTSQKE
jgi:replicative DNA helicase